MHCWFNTEDLDLERKYVENEKSAAFTNDLSYTQYLASIQNIKVQLL